MVNKLQVIGEGDARGCDFRFFEKKLGKKLPPKKGIKVSVLFFVTA
jgi:hypothetical protein